MCRLELDGNNATEIDVPTDLIVEAFDVLGHGRGSRLAFRVDALLDPLLLQAPEEGSATALSQQFARLFMLGSRWLALQKRRHTSLTYCVP